MIYNQKTNQFTCPYCNSHSITVKSGMLCDLYICQNCGYESRDLEYEK